MSPCLDCDGSGQRYSGCVACKGDGASTYHANGKWKDDEPCVLCAGSVRIVDCPTCRGTGEASEDAV